MQCTKCYRAAIARFLGNARIICAFAKMDLLVRIVPNQFVQIIVVNMVAVIFLMVDVCAHLDGVEFPVIQGTKR